MQSDASERSHRRDKTNDAPIFCKWEANANHAETFERYLNTMRNASSASAPAIWSSSSSFSSSKSRYGGDPRRKPLKWNTTLFYDDAKKKRSRAFGPVSRFIVESNGATTKVVVRNPSYCYSSSSKRRNRDRSGLSKGESRFRASPPVRCANERSIASASTNEDRAADGALSRGDSPFRELPFERGGSAASVFLPHLRPLPADATDAMPIASPSNGGRRSGAFRSMRNENAVPILLNDVTRDGPQPRLLPPFSSILVRGEPRPFSSRRSSLSCDETDIDDPIVEREKEFDDLAADSPCAGGGEAQEPGDGGRTQGSRLARNFFIELPGTSFDRPVVLSDVTVAEVSSMRPVRYMKFDRVFSNSTAKDDDRSDCENDRENDRDDDDDGRDDNDDEDEDDDDAICGSRVRVVAYLESGAWIVPNPLDSRERRSSEHAGRYSHLVRPHGAVVERGDARREFIERSGCDVRIRTKFISRQKFTNPDMWL